MKGEWLNVQDMMSETGYVHEPRKRPMKVGIERSQSECSMERWEQQLAEVAAGMKTLCSWMRGECLDASKNAYLIQYGVWRVAPFLQTFKDYPPSQRSASFSIDQMVDELMKTLDKAPTAR